jgi:hypothetical protein
MPGFVDVSNMTSEEVRRMGHADDYEQGEGVYRNPWAYRKPTKKYMPVKLNYNSEDVWGAAWQAYVANGNQYIKAIAPGLNQKTNRTIVEELLADPTQITQEARDQGLIMQRYFHGLTFKMIEGKQLTPFLQGAYDAACAKTITTKLELGIIASLPATYEKMAKRDETERRVQWARGGSVGVVGEKVTLNIEVLKSIWSQKWNIWFITGVTLEDQVVFFSCKENFDIGTHLTITGNVKGERDNSTQLNRVKVI